MTIILNTLEQEALPWISDAEDKHGRNQYLLCYADEYPQTPGLLF